MRKKKRYTRRQRAFRRIAQAVFCLLAVNFLSMHFFFLPGQAVGYQDERLGVYGAKPIARDWTPEFTEVLDYEDADALYLTANGSALCYSTLYYSLLYGWEAQATVLDCSGEGAFHADWATVEAGNGERQLVFYGRLEDHRIRRIGLTAEGTEKTVTYTVESFIEKQGKRYWYQRMDWDSRIDAAAYIVTAAAYDGAGNVVERQDLTH